MAKQLLWNVCVWIFICICSQSCTLPKEVEYDTWDMKLLFLHGKYRWLLKMFSIFYIPTLSSTFSCFLHPGWWIRSKLLVEMILDGKLILIKLLSKIYWFLFLFRWEHLLSILNKFPLCETVLPTVVTVLHTGPSALPHCMAGSWCPLPIFVHVPSPSSSNHFSTVTMSLAF